MKTFFTFLALTVITATCFSQSPRQGLPMPSTRFPKVFNTTTEASITDYDQLIATGDYYFNQKRYGDAIDNYTKAIAQREDQYPKDQLLRAKAQLAREEKETEWRTEEERKAEASRIPSTVFVTRTLQENDWKNAVLVCDVTGSMNQYNDEVLAWLKNSIASGDSAIKRVVLFNDNKKHDLNIPLGLYSFQPTTYEDAVQRVRTAEKEGSGGDIHENNIQALLKAQTDCPTCESMIMVNDNNEPWDFALATQITKPAHIIVCGPPAALEVAFLNLARMTKGSVHFNGRTYSELNSYIDGTTLKVDNTIYMVENDLFKRVN